MEGLVYLFDVDGTLTPPRRKMNGSLIPRFLSWMTGKKVYLVGGSDKEKIFEQLPASVLRRIEGLFCASANELWIKNKLEYKNDWHPPENLINLLKEIYQSSHFKTKGPDFIEKRTGMINFSIIGRKAPPQMREIFYKWDIKNREREEYVKKITKCFPKIDAVIGGQISVDIYPKGRNKSQASQWVRKNLKREMIFFGDKCNSSGNDYPIIQDIDLHQDGKWYCVKSDEETLEILENKYSD